MAHFDAELVAPGISHDHPADVRPLVADDGGAEPDKPGDLLVLRPVVRHDVQVYPVLDDLSLGNLDEVESRPALAHGEIRVSRLGLLDHWQPGYLAPESGERRRIGTVERDVADGRTHGIAPRGKGRLPPGVSGRRKARESGLTSTAPPFRSLEETPGTILPVRSRDGKRLSPPRDGPCASVRGVGVSRREGR